MPESFTPEQFERYVEQMRQATGLLDKIARNLDPKQKATTARPKPASRSSAEAKLEDDLLRKRRENETKRREMDRRFTRSVETTGQALASLGGSTEKVSGSVQSLVRSIPLLGSTLGAITGQMVNYGSTLTKTYRDVAESGQMFSGSVFTMARAAADAGLPLTEFASLIKKNSKLMSSFGVKDVTRMAKNVREMTHKVGMYGYTVDGLNDVTMSYLELQRLYGNKAAARESATAKNASTMALNMTALSKAFGVGRDEILKGAMEGMQQIGMLASFATMEQSDISKQTASFTDAMAIFSTIPGLGKQLQAGLSDAAGFGTSLYNKDLMDFASRTNMTEILGGLDQLSAALKHDAADIDATFDFIEKTNKRLEEQLPSLKPLAAAGDEAAKQAIAAYSQTRLLVEAGRQRYKEERRAAQEMKKMTAFMASLSSQMKILGGKILTGFLKPLESLEANLNDSNSDISKSFARFENMLVEAGSTLGKMFATLITPKNVETLGKAIGLTVDVFTMFANTTLKLLSGWTKMTGALQKVFGDQVGALAGVMIGLVATFKTIDFAKKMLGLRIPSMTVNAGTVVVNGRGGGGGGMFDLGGGEGKGKGGGKGGSPGDPHGGGKTGGRMGRMGGRIGGALAIGTVGALGASYLYNQYQKHAEGGDAPGMGIGTMGGIGMGLAGGAMGLGYARKKFGAAKATAASVAKKAPSRFSKSMAGVRSAAMKPKNLSRLGKIGGLAKIGGKAGGKLIPGLGLALGAGSAIGRARRGDWAGAGLDGLAGVASLVPGIGTAASIGLMGASMARDSGMFDKNDTAAAPSSPSSASDIKISASQVEISTPSMNSLRSPAALPAAPKADQTALLEESRRQNASLERRLTEMKAPVAASDPQMLQANMLMEQMRAMQEAQLAQQKQMIDLMKRNDRYQYEMKTLMQDSTRRK